LLYIAGKLQKLEEMNMGILSGLLGNASEVDLHEVEKELELIVAENERIEKGYKIIRDYLVFTNTRLILIDKQGLTGKKTEFHSIPYKSITHFSVETAGTFDLDSELKIWISSTALPISKQFKKDKSIFDVQKALATYVAR
jgi:Bacterial PH domain